MFKSEFTKANRELITELSILIPSGVTHDTIISTANKAVPFTKVKFCPTCCIVRGIIIRLTYPNLSTYAAKGYTTAIASAFVEPGLLSTTIHTNWRWTKFLLHRVPTFQLDDIFAGKKVAEEIPSTYLGLHSLAQIARWFSTAAARLGKKHSPIIIPVAAQPYVCCFVPYFCFITFV